MDCSTSYLAYPCAVMTYMKRKGGALFGVVLLLMTTWTATAQVTGTRTFVPSPQALGMGGAAVAYPTARTALFYNPAHLTRLKVTRAPVTMLGFGASLSNNLSDQLDFYNDRLQPAIERGIENLEAAEEQALYHEVFEMGRAPTVLSGEVLLPSFVINRGSYGFGGGLFGHTEWTYNVEDGGGGVPAVDFTSLVDLMAVASFGTDFGSVGFKGLSAGVTTKYAQRFMTLKVKPVDALDDDESFYVLGASAAVADVGLLYEANFIPTPGKLYFGMVWSDFALKDFDYRFTAYWAKNEEVQDESAIASEVALAQERYQITSSFRAGVAYVLPGVGGVFKETALALDYVRYGNVGIEQPLLSHLSLGLQTMLGNTFSMRAGLNQGYTTVGAGIQLPFARLDYAFFGSEQGRLPGQAASWHHRIQVSLGSF